jgi:hypothetical protein
MKTPGAFLSVLLASMVGVLAITTAELRANPHVDVGLSIGVPLPHGYLDVVVGREHYYSHRGTFYRRGPHGFVVARAPRGAIVRELPPHCARIYAGRVVYYRYGDVYYQAVPRGYMVVDVYFRKTPEGYKVVPQPWKQ